MCLLELIAAVGAPVELFWLWREGKSKKSLVESKRKTFSFFLKPVSLQLAKLGMVSAKYTSKVREKLLLLSTSSPFNPRLFPWAGAVGERDSFPEPCLGQRGCRWDHVLELRGHLEPFCLSRTEMGKLGERKEGS